MELFLSIFLGTALGLFAAYLCHKFREIQILQRKLLRREKEQYKTLCEIGNDTVTNFNKIFSWIEHELKKDQLQSPGTEL